MINIFFNILEVLLRKWWFVSNDILSEKWIIFIYWKYFYRFNYMLLLFYNSMFMEWLYYILSCFKVGILDVVL